MTVNFYFAIVFIHLTVPPLNAACRTWYRRSYPLFTRYLISHCTSATGFLYFICGIPWHFRYLWWDVFPCTLNNPYLLSAISLSFSRAVDAIFTPPMFPTQSSMFSLLPSSMLRATEHNYTSPQELAAESAIELHASVIFRRVNQVCSITWSLFVSVYPLPTIRI